MKNCRNSSVLYRFICPMNLLLILEAGIVPLKNPYLFLCVSVNGTVGIARFYRTLVLDRLDSGSANMLQLIIPCGYQCRLPVTYYLDLQTIAICRRQKRDNAAASSFATNPVRIS